MSILSSQLYNDFFATCLLNNNTPYCPKIGDSYYMNEQGLEERRFVYLRQETLFDSFVDPRPFVIGEIGFGTGLSFITTLELWKRRARAQQSLVFISLECTPISPLKLEKMLGPWRKELSVEINQLLERYQMLVPGLNILPFLEDRVFLIILVGTAESLLPKCLFTADHWMLDGFSPSKNPSAWSDLVLKEIGRLSQKGTTLCSFSSAGAIRRALSSYGWDVERTRGFSFKKHMTQGIYKGSSVYQLPKKTSFNIAGQGIAGVSIGFFRSILGLKSTLYSYNSLCSSHAPSIYTTPKVHRFFDEMSQLNIQSHFFVGSLYRTLAQYHKLSIMTGYNEPLLETNRAHRLFSELAQNPVWQRMVICENNTLTYPYSIQSDGKNILDLLSRLSSLLTSIVLSQDDANTLPLQSIDALACSWGAQIWGEEFVPSSILRGEMYPLHDGWSSPSHERHAFHSSPSIKEGFVGFRTQIRSHVPLFGTYQNQYLSLHHGSRGFSSGPWCGLLIALSSGGIFEYDFAHHEQKLPLQHI
jgi:tRNA U34 5-methylaminomethyl-2-thiouridine-forming methyltransferase MnmC